VTEGEPRQAYRVEISRQTIEPPSDLSLSVAVKPGDTYQSSTVMLARASSDGTFELLTAAWSRVLGYALDELEGKTLGELMADGETAGPAAAAILDRHDMRPVTLALRCRDGRGKHFRLHRRVDDYDHRIFIVAEETTAPQGAIGG
jgi:PAS domain S-box-containing protein